MRNAHQLKLPFGAEKKCALKFSREAMELVIHAFALVRYKCITFLFKRSTYCMTEEQKQKCSDENQLKISLCHWEMVRLSIFDF